MLCPTLGGQQKWAGGYGGNRKQGNLRQQHLEVISRWNKQTLGRRQASCCRKKANMAAPEGAREGKKEGLLNPVQPSKVIIS